MRKYILSTTNYDMFIPNSLNRDIKNTKKLEKSMIEHGFLDAYPIHCVRTLSGKLRIIGGHNRFHVASKLCVPVKYIIEDEDINPVELEKATKPWTLQDYFDAHCKDGNAEYLKVKKYIKETGIPLSHALSLMVGETAGSSNQYDACKNGTYKTRDSVHAYDVKRVILKLKQCGIAYGSTGMLVQAVSRVLRVLSDDIELLLRKIEANTHIIKKQPNVERYIEMIEELYNLKQRDKNKIPLAFLVKQELARRKITFGK